MRFTVENEVLYASQWWCGQRGVKQMLDVTSWKKLRSDMRLDAEAPYLEPRFEECNLLLETSSWMWTVLIPFLGSASCTTRSLKPETRLGAKLVGSTC